jgi:orotate phosphoribosyltransferase
MNSEEVLEMFRESAALLDGHFELRSGLHSRQYFQCAMVLRYPNLATRLCAELAKRVQTGLGTDFAVDGVIAPAMGGILVGHEVARILNVKSLFAEKQEGRLTLRMYENL